MNSSTLSNTGIEKFIPITGTENIVFQGDELNHLLQNTSHFEAPEVLGLIRIKSQSMLDGVVEIANQNSTPIYTYSKGLNWGLGSKLPVVDGCILLDLSALNEILLINEKFHFAIVEPGVSQGELAEEIEKRNLSLMVNVTGSAPQSSVLGNCMERGSGFLAHRIEDIRGMEVLLADGLRVKSGFWNLEKSNETAQYFPFGMGPDWRGIFSQSNLGIVTKLIVNLYPKKEVQKMIWIKVEQAHLPTLVDTLADLYQRKYIHSVTHIGNDKRMKIENQNKENSTIWTAMAMIQGSENFVRFLETEIPEYFKNICDSMGFLSKEEAKGQNLGEVFGCHTGKPTDYFVRAMYQSEGATLDRKDLQIDLGKYGMLCCLPILPANGPDIEKATQILDSIEADFGIIPAATLNPLNDLYLESVINIYFDRTDASAVALAHKANNEMIRRFYDSGFRFYRFDVKTMHDYIDPQNPHWQLVAKLKNALDPNRIFSPGRYESQL